MTEPPHPLPNFPDQKGPPGAANLPWGEQPPHPVEGGPPGAAIMPWEDPPPSVAASTEGMHVIMEELFGVTPKDLIPDGGLLFQCPPLDEFSVDYAHGHTDYETIENQHSRKGVPQLATVTFDTLVVDYARFAVDQDAAEIETIRDTLKEVCLSGEPFLLTAAHQLPPRGYSNWSLVIGGPEVQMPATLRSLKVTEKAGEGDARYLAVSFVEYREPTLTRTTTGKKRSGGKTTFPTTVVLYGSGRTKWVRGTTLVDVPFVQPPLRPLTLGVLAKNFYGDSSRWRGIARANNIVSWGANDALITHPRFSALKDDVGIKILIPKPGSGA
jgi:hypothetical protein